MSKQLPPSPNLEHLKKQAKDLLAAIRKNEQEAIQRASAFFPQQHKFALTDAQLVVAREYGFDSWSKLRKHVEQSSSEGPAAAFLAAEDSGDIETAARLWQEHRPALRKNLVCALRAGDIDAVAQFLAEDPRVVNENLPPHDQPLLSYVCFSSLIRDAAFEQPLLETARLLLRAGADPNAQTPRADTSETWQETALYGAAGVLNHAGLTKLLLEAGADPDDKESLYHASEHTGQNECLRLLLEASRNTEWKSYCIKRKLDYEDPEGARMYLEHGADPNLPTPTTALSHAVLRGRSNAILQVLIDGGADPSAKDADGSTPYALARRLGARETANFLEAHGADTALTVQDQIVVAAVDGDAAAAARIAAEHSGAVAELASSKGQGSAGQAIHELARLGNIPGVMALLDLGLDVNIPTEWNETPLHWASLSGNPTLVRLLLERGASLDNRDSNHGGTPIGWACWGSLFAWQPRGDYVATVQALLEAGAVPDGEPIGSPEVLAVFAG